MTMKFQLLIKAYILKNEGFLCPRHDNDRDIGVITVCPYVRTNESAL